jgi:hypothetical protein
VVFYGQGLIISAIFEQSIKHKVFQIKHNPDIGNWLELRIQHFKQL